MAFAVKLIAREVTLEQCSPLFEPRNEKLLKTLTDLLRPSVKAVVIGTGERAVTIGEKDTVYRHELAFPNPTAIAIDVHDKMGEEEIIQRIKGVESFVFSRIGQDLRLDLIAVRCTSGDPIKFAKRVATITQNSTLPMILCSLDSEAIGKALEVVGDRKPLIYAATEHNWREMGKLALQYDCPIAVFTPNDIGMLKSLSHALREMGLDNIVLDPGSYVKGATLSATIDNFAMIRRAAIEGNDRDLGYPLIAVPATVWLAPKGDAVGTKFREACLACMFIVRYADLLIMHSTDIWAILPVLTLRQCIYTDPRKPVAVEPGLREIGTPNENSPVMVTSNFALTYTTVESDLLGAKINCYLLVIDTEGLSVETSVAGGQLNADKIAEAIKAVGIEQKVRHRRLIIPGFASRLRGEIEDLTNWEVLVGPRDSSQIPEFLEKYWKR
jgi:acetyl-CoA decarbonylase/synthase complex subunit gamma